MSKTYTFTADTINTDLFFGEYSRFYVQGSSDFDCWADTINTAHPTGYTTYDSNPDPESGQPRKPIGRKSSSGSYEFWRCKIYYGAQSNILDHINSLDSSNIISMTLATQCEVGSYSSDSVFYWDTALNPPDLTTPACDFMSNHKTGGLQTIYGTLAGSSLSGNVLVDISIDVKDYGIPSSYSWFFRYARQTYGWLYTPVVLTIVTAENDYSYTLAYSANGGSGAPSSQIGSNTLLSPSYTFTISSTVPTRSGYNFLGWSTSSSAITADYQPGDSITVTSDGTTTLYAVWKIANILRIVNNNQLDMYIIYIVENSSLVPYRMTIVNNGQLDDYM